MCIRDRISPWHDLGWLSECSEARSIRTAWVSTTTELTLILWILGLLTMICYEDATAPVKPSSIDQREDGPIPARRCSCTVADNDPADLFPSSSTATNHGTVKFSASLPSHFQLGAPVMSMNVCTQSMEQDDQIVARINFAC